VRAQQGYISYNSKMIDQIPMITKNFSVAEGKQAVQATGESDQEP
jgi:hypothetical protein